MSNPEKTKEQLEQERREEEELLARIASDHLEDNFPCTHDTGIRCKLRQECYEGGRTKPMCDIKECKHNNSRIIRIYRPSFQDKNDADRYKNSYYIKALKDGLLPRQQLIGEAKLAGIWTDEKEARTSELVAEVEELITEQNKAKNLAKKRKLSARINELKAEQLQIAMEYSEITQYSIDQYLDNAEQSFLIVRCAKEVSDNGKETPIYPSVGELNQERDLDFVQRLTSACSTYWMGEGLEDFLEYGQSPGDMISEQDTDSQKN